MNTHDLWQAVLGELELSVSRANFTTWFHHTSIASIENGRVVINVPNTFTKTWLEKKYHTAIINSLQSISGFTIKEVIYNVRMTNVVFTPSKNDPQQITPTPTIEIHKPKQIAGLNPRYIFENFIVGKGNELAHAAAKAVVDNPGKRYNPLFIYGGVGLGKTHLLQAIGHSLIQKNPSTKVLYVTCERFTNDYIYMVRNGRAKEFKDIYRNVDLLLIDDIQFIAGKEETQGEFFHTFNALHQENKQIVISSDRQPKAILALEDRLKTRFEWGMVADISSPDFETRIAILETKCRENNYFLPKELIHYVATVIQSNVRELEGALTKIIAYHQFKNIQPTLDKTKQIISSFIVSPPTKRTLSTKSIIEAVSGYFDINIGDILGKSREKKLALPRQIIMYLLRNELKNSFPAIGKEIGGRDHTTAIHACNKISKEIVTDQRLKQDIEVLRERLFQSV